MTHIELRDSLMNRVGWKQPTGSPYTIDTDNSTTESGRYFQDEHAFVTLDNIHSTMEKVDTSTIAFNAYLKELRQRAIILVISDVFKMLVIDDDLLLDRLNLLDDCISKRMAIIVGETILTSTRSNFKETVTKEFMQTLFFEVNGSQGNPNFPNYIGIKSRYGKCVKHIQDDLGQEPALDVVTYRLPNYDNDDAVIL